MTHWAFHSIFYHLYPFGLCDAPHRNDFQSTPQPRLKRLHVWLDHIQALGANALYLGPVFESSTHGYDTADYYNVDRRLGENATLSAFSADLHQRGMRLILDGVFNHVGRDFWAFRDVQHFQQQSAYVDWFYNLRFGQRNSYGDPFSYEGWNGYLQLVKLNLRNPAVRAHLFEAIATWVREFDIDGLRLDAADCLEEDFLIELARFCRGLKPDFFLVGEVVHGDYRHWAAPDRLDAVTNYECYKGLYSSHVDQNYFEIAYSLNRQFGKEGLYRNLPLYAFADNHDVSRVASLLTDPAHLYPLYLLLMSMPGTPSIYYGSEWGLTGVKETGGDWNLRPALDPAPWNDLTRAIARLAAVRRSLPALCEGDYQQVFVQPLQLAFCRTAGKQTALVVVNASHEPAKLEIPLPVPGEHWVDVLNPGRQGNRSGQTLRLNEVPACWGQILVSAID